MQTKTTEFSIESLLNVAKVALFAPPIVLLLVGIAIRLKMLDSSQSTANQFIEVTLAMIFYLTLLVGLITLMLSLLTIRKKNVARLPYQLRNLLIYSGLAISPLWLFILWLFITGSNR